MGQQNSKEKNSERLKHQKGAEDSPIWSDAGQKKRKKKEEEKKEGRKPEDKKELGRTGARTMAE